MSNGSEVTLAAIALAATMGGAVIWIAKYFAKELTKDLKEHTKAAQQQVQASKDQAKVSKEALAASREVLIFMKNLNGKLATATIRTARSNEKILETLQESSDIAAEDRDVLTNQNIHIRTEVRKELNKKK